MSKHLVRLFTNLVFWLSEMAEEVRTDEKICTICGFEGIYPERKAEILMIGISAFLVFSEWYSLYFKDLTAKIIDDTILI